MQFIQPTGFPSYGQPCSHNTPMPIQYNGYPEIIGEGNITPLISPDGTTHLLFVPTAHWQRPWPPNTNLNNPYVGNLGAWVVRSFNNQLQQPAGYAQQQQNPWGLQSTPANSTFCLNTTSPGFQLKFHNDVCTSTSDLHYFFPKRDSVQNSVRCVRHQISVATNTSQTGPIQCNCAPESHGNCANKLTENDTAKCNRVENTNNSNRESTTRKHKGRNSCRKKVSYESMCSCSSSGMSTQGYSSEYLTRSSRHRPHKTKSIKYSVKCACDQRKPLDKSIATYNHQGTACNTEKCRQIQTDHSNMSLCCSVLDCNKKSEDVAKNTTISTDMHSMEATNISCECYIHSTKSTNDTRECGCFCKSDSCKDISIDPWIPTASANERDGLVTPECEYLWNSRNSASDCLTQSESEKLIMF